jgi:hypothetical protein
LKSFPEAMFCQISTDHLNSYSLRWSDTLTEKSDKQGRRTYPIVMTFPSLLQDADCSKYGRPMQAVQGAVLAVVLTTGMGLALPQEYLPAARADNSFVSAAERRRQEALQRRELLTKA